jgi:hypothetical protein
MKVLVVFHLPKGSGLPYCALEHLLPLIPAIKSTYTFDRKRYEVVSMHEDMDRREGPMSTATNRLVAMLASLTPDDPQSAVSRLAELRNIGIAPSESVEKSAGGLIIKEKTDVFPDVERLLMLEMKYVGPVPHIDIDALLRGEAEPRKKGTGSRRS